MNIYKFLLVNVVLISLFVSCEQWKENLSNQVSSQSISNVDLFYDSEDWGTVQVGEKDIQKFILNTLKIKDVEFRNLKVVNVNNYALIESVIIVDGLVQKVGIVSEDYKNPDGSDKVYLLGKISYCKGSEWQLIINDGPLLDRIDLHVEVTPVQCCKLSEAQLERSYEIREREKRHERYKMSAMLRMKVFIAMHKWV